MNPDAAENELSDLERRRVEYFDGELDAGERANFESRIAVEPALREGLENWTFVGEMLRAGLDAQAQALPQARFEQAWDQFDATLAREGRLQEAAAQKPTLWARVAAFIAPIRVPLAMGAAAAVVAVVAFSGGQEPSANPAVAQAAEGRAPQEVAAPAPATEAAAPAPKLAVAPTPAPADIFEDFPVPQSNEAEIERIEFGGRSGTISQLEGARGTTTVIWVQEDEEPVESERSL